MNFAKVLFLVFSCFLALSVVSASPRWNPFKKLEKAGRNIRDGIIKAGPAVQVVGQASSIYKQG